MVAGIASQAKAECNPSGADTSFIRTAPFAQRILVGRVVDARPDPDGQGPGYERGDHVELQMDRVLHLRLVVDHLETEGFAQRQDDAFERADAQLGRPRVHAVASAAQRRRDRRRLAMGRRIAGPRSRAPRGTRILAEHVIQPRRADILGAAGGDLVLPGPAGELDQVLVELEPDAVVAVDAGRRDEAPVAADGPPRAPGRGGPGSRPAAAQSVSSGAEPGDRVGVERARGGRGRLGRRRRPSGR